ncbi:PASTA domain-containing protein [Roseivirga sp. BDSF3-8]|uniref:PASTA domain-containing protein n=1 Tax=Roseivirga sp. BDSF3-8 TaxID=3241598 RepID=UPI0035319470
MSTDMKDILSAPLGNLIASIGEGVAEAQKALDAASLAQTLAIYSDEEGDDMMNKLRAIGYQPTFYVLPETEVEAKVSLALTASGTTSAPGTGQLAHPRKARAYATPVNANTNNKYNLNAEASATLKFKIVPVPPAEGTTDLRVAPNLVGKELNMAATILQRLNLQYSLTTEPQEGQAVKITAQTPAPGEILRAGDVLELEVA